MNPTISIIIPTYNSIDFIGATLNSLISQTFKNWEAIVVDDGSTDATITELTKFSALDRRIKFFKRIKNAKGGSVCRNMGLERAQGKYVIFLDSDDLLADFCLTQRIDVMYKHKSLDFAVFKMERFNLVPGDCDESAVNFESSDPLKAFLEGVYPLPWTITSPIWRKETLIKLGGFDEQFLRLQDPELHTRALLVEDICFKICSDFPNDCFYRKSNSNIFSNERLLRVIKSFHHFLYKTAPLVKTYDLKNKTDYFKSLKKLLWTSQTNLRIRSYMFPEFNSLLQTGLKLGVIKTHEYILMSSSFVFKMGIYTGANYLYKVYYLRKP